MKIKQQTRRKIWLSNGIVDFAANKFFKNVWLVNVRCSSFVELPISI